MIPDKLPLSVDATDEVSTLIETLLKTSQRVEELTGGEVDTVLDSNGRAFLLPSAQDQLRSNEAARLTAILNALPANIALLDFQGGIVLVNEAWRQHADANALTVPGYGVGLNYLDFCDRACGGGSSDAQHVAKGIRSVLNSKEESFSMEYPSHSPTEQRWFLLTVTPVARNSPNGAVIMHLNITERKLASSLVVESRQRLALATESAHIGIWDWDVAANKMIWDRQMYELYGLREQDFTGAYDAWQQGLHPEDRSRAEAEIAAALAGDKDFHSEFRVMWPNGEVRDIEAHGLVQRACDGMATRMIGVNWDITGRKRGESALRESNEKFRQLADNLTDAFWIRSPDMRELYYMSPAFARIWGRSVESMYANPQQWADFILPEDRERVAGAFTALSKDASNLDIEYRIVRPDGALRWIRSRGFQVRDAANTLIRQTGIMTDITAQRQAADALRESEERYRDLFENASDLIQTVAANGALLYVNQAWRAALGYKEDDMPSLKFLDLISPDQHAQTELWFRQALAGAPVSLVESQFVSKTHKQILVEGSVSPKVVNGEVVSLRCIFRDVTEKKGLEAQFLRAQRLEGIGALASGVAHDLNNMLAPILMSAPMLRWGLKPEQFEATLNTIESCAQRGAEMVKQLLTFGRGVEGQRVLLQPDRLIREIIKIVEGTFPKSVRVRSSREGASWPVLGDPTQLHQVLLNLCVNARDAMPKGGTLTYKAENVTLDQQYAAMATEAKAGPYVIIRVADTGTGIPKGVLDRMFEPFFTTKELGIGTGLGLSTVLGIVRSHGGFIKVDTEMGRGTEFAVYLPAAPERSLQGDKGDPSPVPEGNGETVLVVDDEAVITEACRSSLEKHGYRVLIAHDGVEALTIYATRAAEIGAIISDLEMPFLDGVGLVRAVKRMQPEARILIATAIDSSDARNDKVAQLREIGANSFLTKPFNSNTLLLALHHQFHP
jgi:PAS domain S-box-containing protein